MGNPGWEMCRFPKCPSYSWLSPVCTINDIVTDWETLKTICTIVYIHVVLHNQVLAIMITEWKVKINFLSDVTVISSIPFIVQIWPHSMLEEEHSSVQVLTCAVFCALLWLLRQ